MIELICTGEHAPERNCPYKEDCGRFKAHKEFVEYGGVKSYLDCPYDPFSATCKYFKV